jgi:hypothetical protein
MNGYPQQLWSMTKKLLSFIIVCALFISAHAALASDVIVGVNAWYIPPNMSQEDMIKQLAENGVKTIRTSLMPNTIDFITEAYHHGIGSVVIVYPLPVQRPRRSRPGQMSRYQNSIRKNSPLQLSPYWINWKREACASPPLSSAMRSTRPAITVILPDRQRTPADCRGSRQSQGSGSGRHHRWFSKLCEDRSGAKGFARSFQAQSTYAHHLSRNSEDQWARVES